MPVICADRGYYSDWPFTHFACSREHYKDLLTRVVELCESRVDGEDMAAACFAAALSQPNDIDRRMRLECDSMTTRLYKGISSLHQSKSNLCLDESRLISEWLSSGFSSYAVYALLKGLSYTHDFE